MLLLITELGVGGFIFFFVSYLAIEMGTTPRELLEGNGIISLYRAVGTPTI